jgi:hypothetical protein
MSRFKKMLHNKRLEKVDQRAIKEIDTHQRRFCEKRPVSDDLMLQ